MSVLLEWFLEIIFGGELSMNLRLQGYPNSSYHIIRKWANMEKLH